MNSEELQIVDPIHGKVIYPKIIADIVATEHFQRLRHVKQLGLACFTFVGANHTRYEHCLGVCFKVKEWLDVLKHTITHEISEFHFNCAMIAGLLHDIGHGPFSHVWERFVHQASCTKDWTHEETSVAIIKHLFAVNPAIKLHEEPEEHAKGINLIGAMITGNEQVLAELLGDELYFLGEIVNNNTCGIDVDKYDYMLRDKHYLENALPNDVNIKFDVLFNRATVMKMKDGKNHITFNEEDLELIANLYETRFKLHSYCYSSAKVSITEIMLLDAFKAAEQSGFVFNGIKLSETHTDISKYLLLDDSIVDVLLNEPNDLGGAKVLLQRLVQHRPYQLSISQALTNPLPVNTIVIKRRIHSAREMIKGQYKFYLQKKGRSKLLTADQLPPNFCDTRGVKDDMFVCVN